MPLETGLGAVGRFENKGYNDRRTRYGLIITASGGRNNIAIKATGNIVADQIITSYTYVASAPGVNTVFIPTYEKDDIGLVVVTFKTSNSGTGLPYRTVISEKHGIN